jgi:polyhydroxyalkanoate synthesis regulator phasin
MKFKVFAAIFGVLLALGIISVGTTLAQSNVPTTVEGLAQVLQTGTTNYCQAWQESLAKQLGVTVEKLQASEKAAAKEMVDLALKEGKITADQATAAKTRIDAADAKNCQFGGHFGKGGPFGFPFPGIPGAKGRVEAGFALLRNGMDSAAKALNMTAADLMAQLRQGKSVADVAKEKNIALETVKKAVVDAETALIDQAAKDGKITADQATKLKEALAAKVDNFLNAKHQAPQGGPGRGFPKHR